jgi:hypothetical protein
MRSVASSMNDAIVQSPVQPQTPYAKFRRISRRDRCAPLGMKQQRVEDRVGASIAAIGAVALVAATRNRAAPPHVVAMARPDRRSREPAEQLGGGPLPCHVHVRVAELPLPGRRTSPPSTSVISCMP